MEPPFDLMSPDRPDTGAIFAVPHSGRSYGRDLLEASVLSPEALRSSEDAFVDRLFAAAPGQGAPLLVARHPRAWIDLNRGSDELDPALIEGLGRGTPSPRVASGLGVVPRVVSGGRAIYAGKIPLQAARARIREVWTPYHAALRRLIDAAREAHGRAILVDCHSMPREALDGLARTGPRPEVVIGDRYGAAAATEIVDAIEALFLRSGLKVSRNAPFAGAYVAQQYGRPARGSHVVQIEIDRSLYMDEKSLETHAGFADLKVALDEVIAGIARIGRSNRMRLAAE